jgi:hypothetical protein
MSRDSIPENSCALAQERMPDYWQGDISPDDRAWIEQHLATCNGCAKLCAAWRELGELPEAKADPFQRRRFDAMLAAHLADDSRRSAFMSFVGWLHPLPAALGLTLLLAGFVGGWWVRGNSRPVAQGQDDQIALLRGEVHATDQLLVLSMLQQQSANDRLEGISYSNRLSQLNPRIVDALLRSLRYDSSPDVRLAALDVLQHAGNAGKATQAVARGLVDSFPDQNSPLMQVALVDSFLELRPPAARELLEKVSANPAYSPEVRQRASWGLSQWN